jgi:hypothetical protein
LPKAQPTGGGTLLLLSFLVLFIGFKCIFKLFIHCVSYLLPW